MQRFQVVESGEFVFRPDEQLDTEIAIQLKDIGWVSTRLSPHQYEYRYRRTATMTGQLSRIIRNISLLAMLGLITSFLILYLRNHFP